MKFPRLPRVRCFPDPHPSEGPAGGTIGQENRSKLERVCRLCRRNRRGAAVVEFAVVAPLFFLLVFGMIEFGRMVMVQQIITNGSREGARIAVLDGTTTDEVVSAVQDYLASASINVEGAEITAIATDDETGAERPLAQSDYGDAVTVTVSVPFGQVSWLPTPMFLGGSTMTATTVMRRETVQ